ncbi:MAG: extracellular solute-binding protein [Clostridia bacterium]|nr:extracellular solute-binding protein [Clostridia bacterium]
MRIFTAFLAVLMLLSFAACAGDNGASKDTGKTTSPTDGTTAPSFEDVIDYEKDDLPASLNFGGDKVVVLSASIYNAEGEEDRMPEFSVEELTSDVINDSIYNRELSVEDRLDIEIVNAQVTVDKLTTEIEKQYNAGDDSYDVVIHANHTLARYVFDGYFTDLYTVDYLNFDKPWWSDKFNSEAELMDMLFMTTGSLSLSLTRNIYAMYYNKALAENYSSDIEELGDLYTVVENGDWTFDKFVELGGEIYKDTNGDTLYDIDDEYGIAYVPYIPLDAIWSSFDINIFSRTEDGWFEMDVNTDKLYTALDKMYSLIHDTKGSMSSGGFGVDFYDVHKTFANGHVLFMPNMLGVIETPELRNMQDDYGILPYPKYDDSQKEYYSYSHDQYTAFAIPITSSKPDTAGAMLEAMASYAYRDTQPAYFNTALKGKYMSDPQSRKMLDIVVEGFMVDAAWIYLGNLAADYPPSFRYMIARKEESFAVNHQKLSKRAEIYLKTYKASFEKVMG